MKSRLNQLLKGLIYVTIRDMNAKIFKAYDIRGKYPEDFNASDVFKIAQALARFFKKGKIIVGYDARIDSHRLYQSVIKGLTSSNSDLKVLKTGMITTPMMYFLVNSLKTRGGIMITASHNPKEFNGLKVVGRASALMSGLEIKKLLGIG